MYSQNQEEKHIREFFKGFTGTLLDIGANDGKTFSNSLRLIELGWKAVLVEPSNAGWEKLLELHGNNERVTLMPAAIGTANARGILYESGAHVPRGTDRALVSTLNQAETIKWKNVAFEAIEVEVISYPTLCDRCEIESFDFITIDAEGMDLEILNQIDLSKTQLLCIEWNSVSYLENKIQSYCARFGMKNVIYRSGENLLIAR